MKGNMAKSRHLVGKGLKEEFAGFKFVGDNIFGGKQGSYKRLFEGSQAQEVGIDGQEARFRGVG